MVPWRPKQGQGVRDLVLIGCARGLDAQAESWRLQGHIDSGCQKEALIVLSGCLPPGSRADNVVKIRYMVPCGLTLATSKPSGQHDTGPGYSPVPTVPCAGRRASEFSHGGQRGASEADDGQHDSGDADGVADVPDRQAEQQDGGTADRDVERGEQMQIDVRVLRVKPDGDLADSGDDPKTAERTPSGITRGSSGSPLTARGRPSVTR
jgi:hypothetical protein